MRIEEYNREKEKIKEKEIMKEEEKESNRLKVLNIAKNNVNHY